MAFCGSCGNELREGAKFCPKCGTAVNGYQDQQETKGKRFSTPWISAFAVLTILIGSYFVTDMVSPETHNKMFGWVTFGNSPSNTVKKATNCLKNYDFDGFFNYCYFGKNTSPKELEGQKTLMLAFGREKLEKEIEEKNGIKDFNIISEKIEGDNAEVDYTILYGNGEKETRTHKLKKDINGKWLISID